MAITPLLSSKRESEASSANTCPPTRVSSNGGLVHAHHHPPCCILRPSTPSLAQNASRRAVLLPPTLCPAFRATEGFVHAHQALRCSKRELEGPFCQPPPSDSSFKREALFMPTTPSLAQNASRRVRSAPTCPPSRVSSDGGLCSCPARPARPPLPKTRVGRVCSAPHLPSVSRFERRRALFMPNTPCLARNASWRVRSAPTCPPSRISSGGLCSLPPSPPSLETRVGGSILPPPASVSHFERRRSCSPTPALCSLITVE